MPRSIWNGVISFGMVSIPVKLYAATENKDVAFHQLHNVCDTRIKYQKFCPHCERTVETDEIEKGFEFSKGQYVILTEEDFEHIPLSSKHTIEVSAFVQKQQIDPVYYEKAYYLEADEAALRPFTLFMKAITDMDVVAIAAITLRNKERLCALRPLGGTLLLDTLLYPDEIRIDKTAALPTAKISDKELNMAEHLIKLMAQDFKPENYHDHYRQALKQVIQSKLEGKEIAVSAETPRAKVIDLMEALRASVDNIRQTASTSGKDKAERSSKRSKPAETLVASATDQKPAKAKQNKSAAKTRKTKPTADKNNVGQSKAGHGKGKKSA